MNDRSHYPGWSEVVFTVDSGASETVVGLNALESLPVVQGVAAQNGAKYECANGAIIENIGGKTVHRDMICKRHGWPRDIETDGSPSHFSEQGPT